MISSNPNSWNWPRAAGPALPLSNSSTKPDGPSARPARAARTILHPTDYSELSQIALDRAAHLARSLGTGLLILHVVDTLGPENLSYGEAHSLPQPQAYRQRLWEEFHQRVPVVDVPGPVEYLLGEGDPSAAIVHAAAEHRCELIVLADDGARHLGHWLLGSTVDRVLRQAPCPVVVVTPVAPERVAQRPPSTELHPYLLKENADHDSLQRYGS